MNVRFLSLLTAALNLGALGVPDPSATLDGGCRRECQSQTFRLVHTGSPAAFFRHCADVALGCIASPTVHVTLMTSSAVPHVFPKRRCQVRLNSWICDRVKGTDCPGRSASGRSR